MDAEAISRFTVQQAGDQNDATGSWWVCGRPSVASMLYSAGYICLVLSVVFSQVDIGSNDDRWWRFFLFVGVALAGRNLSDQLVRVTILLTESCVGLQARDAKSGQHTDADDAHQPSRSRLYDTFVFYASAVKHSAEVLAWAIALTCIWMYVLGTKHTGQSYVAVRSVLLSIVAVVFMSLLRLLITTHALISTQRAHFFPQLQEALQNEMLLGALSQRSPARRERLERRAIRLQQQTKKVRATKSAHSALKKWQLKAVNKPTNNPPTFANTASSVRFPTDGAGSEISNEPVADAGHSPHRTTPHSGTVTPTGPPLPHTNLDVPVTTSDTEIDCVEIDMTHSDSALPASPVVEPQGDKGNPGSKVTPVGKKTATMVRFRSASSSSVQRHGTDHASAVADSGAASWCSGDDIDFDTARNTNRDVSDIAKYIRARRLNLTDYFESIMALKTPMHKQARLGRAEKRNTSDRMSRRLSDQDPTFLFGPTAAARGASGISTDTVERNVSNVTTDSTPEDENTVTARYAELIYTRVKMPGATFITQRDLYDFLTPRAAQRAMKKIDISQTQAISKTDLQDFCDDVFQKRRELVSNLKATKRAVGELAVYLWVFTAPILDLTLVLVVCGVDFERYVLVFSSLIVGFLVAFSPFVRRFMLAAQFVFVRRPYHIGDTVRITQDGTGRTMIVKAISLMDTTFVMIFGGGNLVWDNSVLLNSTVLNISQGLRLWKQIVFMVDNTFDGESLRHLESKLRAFVQSDPVEYGGHVDAYARAATAADGQHYPMKMMVEIWLELSHPGSNCDRAARAVTRVTMVASDILLNELGVTFTTPEGSIECRQDQISSQAPTQDPGVAATTVSEPVSRLQSWRGRKHKTE
eukprot:m.504816 g.504816  ORF g.504816 m.504816 type:complete len:868 (-) comp21863_c0_seq12:2111-4714(-)